MKAQELKAQVEELIQTINQLNEQIKAADLILAELREKVGL